MSERAHPAPPVGDGLVDHGDRERIRTALDETLVVEAAAGTGKTTELVRRLVRVLAEGRGSVETIAALTFTEKAAGELKLRLRTELEEERRRVEPGSAAFRRLEDTIARLEEARISTIHGFCNDLLHERPVEARVDPRFEVLTEAEATALYRQAFDAWLADKLEDPPEGIRRALRRRSRDADGDPIDRLRDVGWSLGEWRDFRAPWRRADFQRDAAIDALVRAVHDLSDKLKTSASNGDSLFADTWLARRLSDDTRARERAQPRDADGLEAALIGLLRDSKFRKPRKGSERNYRRGVSRAEILDGHAALLDALEVFERHADADLAALLQQELAGPIERYQELKRRAGALDFVDLLLVTRDVLRGRADVRAELQNRLTHLFVDEFQDTDPLQAEILLLLACANPAIDRWRDVVPAPGKLFIVGDPKQSIYRFRRADVGVYQEVKALLLARGATAASLRTSFRAVPSLQNLINAAFAPAMTDDRATLQAGYVPLAPHREALAGQPSVVALPVPKPYGFGAIRKNKVEESLPDAVGAFVRWLIEDSGWKVTEREHPHDPVKISARHVCLLFRRFTSWGRDVTRLYVEALEARGIPHVLVGGKSFHLREEVESLRAALTAVEWPDDELALYATLRGPLFAVGDEELLEYRHHHGRLHPYRLPKDDPPDSLRPIVDALALLRSLHRSRNYRPVEATVDDLLTATRGHATFVLRPGGEQALANVLRIAELARTYEASGGISFRGFVDLLREDADGEAPEAPIVEEGSEGVRIMTVHRAKGLEFPVVVLADITASIAGRPSRHVDAERGLSALRLAGWTPWDLLDHEEEEGARERAEGVRVAYVAATRARDLLVVPAVGDDPFQARWDGAIDGWIEPIHRAIYPAADARQSSTAAPGCPELGDDSVLERDDREGPGRDTVRPGLHAFASPAGVPYSVVWWDPGRLELGVEKRYGLRREDLIKEPVVGTVEADRKRYDDWLAERRLAQEGGARPSIAVRTVVEWAQRKRDERELPEVSLVEVGSHAARPTGARFGTLVHATLATVPLDADAEATAQAVELQARIVGAEADEVAAARSVVATALDHPLLARAREAWWAGRCRRETPITSVEPDGSLVEGVLDLAFEEAGGWIVVDFKTDAEIATALERYRRQVGFYAAVVQQATGAPVRAILMRV